MSPWWREQVLVSIAPHEVVLRRWSRGPRRRERELQRCDVTGSPGVPAWGPALHAFAASAGPLNWRHADLQIAMSGHFVRYHVLPRIEKLSDTDAQSYAEQQYQALYGATAQSWTVSVSRGAPGLSRIAVATDRALLHAMQSLALHLGMRLRSVRPMLSDAIDALGRRDPQLNGWLAVVESGRVSVVRLARGRCENIRTARCDEDPAAAVLALLQQDVLCAQLETVTSKLYLQSPSPIDSSRLRDHGWQVLASKNLFP